MTVQDMCQTHNTVETTQAKIFLLVGPAGVGKSTLISMLDFQNLNLTYIPSYVTRPMRKNETQGKPYHFISLKDFSDLQAEDDFIEANEVYGHWYGTSKSAYMQALSEGKNIVKDIDMQGAKHFKEVFGSQAILIFILPPTLDILRERLESRGEAQDIIELRHAESVAEIKQLPLCDCGLVNKDLEEATNSLTSFIRYYTEKG